MTRVACEGCGNPAEYIGASGDPLCRDCLVSNLRYGHEQSADPDETLGDWIADGLRETPRIEDGRCCRA